MLDIKWIRDNPDALDRALRMRGAEPIARDLIALDDKRRRQVTALQETQEQRNAASKEIGRAMASGDAAGAERLKAEVAKLKSTLQEGEQAEKRLTQALNDALALIPNVPLDDVPVGPDESANVEIRRLGFPRD